MNAAVGLTAGLGLDGDRCIRVIPRQYTLLSMEPDGVQQQMRTVVFVRNLLVTRQSTSQLELTPLHPTPGLHSTNLS